MKPFLNLVLIWSKGYTNQLMSIIAEASQPVIWHYPPVSRFEVVAPLVEL